MRFLSALALLALAAPLAARADTLDLHFTPDDGDGGVYDFTSDQNPITGTTAGSGFFQLNPVGTGGFFAGPDVVFFITSGSIYGGNIQLDNSDLSTQLIFDGPQLFSGTEDAPTLLTGTFQLTNLTIPSPNVDMDGNITYTFPVPDGDQPGQDYTLTVTDLTTASPTPEPSSFILLGTGVLGLAGAARRRFFAKR